MDAEQILHHHGDTTYICTTEWNLTTLKQFNNTKLCIKMCTIFCLGSVLCLNMCNFMELPIKIHWVGIFKSTYIHMYIHACRVKAKTAYLSKVRTPSNDDDTASTES